MSPTRLARVSAALVLLPIVPGPTSVRVTLATLHAAALTAPRAAADSVDRPYLLVSVVGPRAKAISVRLPSTGQMRIRLDEALGARPLVDLTLAPGDTVRLLISALSGSATPSADDAAASASTRVLAAPRTGWASGTASALAPLTGHGTRWLGSTTLLLTNEGGTTYWRALECVATCNVLSGAAAAALTAPGAPPVAGVVELKGAGGTYHMQLQARQGAPSAS